MQIWYLIESWLKYDENYYSIYGLDCHDDFEVGGREEVGKINWRFGLGLV